MAELTVVFADLTGSTGVFEALGNAKATKAISKLTDWLGTAGASRGGLMVKNLGDGVLMVFASNANAIDAVIDMQRLHTERIKAWPDELQMRLQVGLARGDVIEQAGDYFGDTVNLASRLSDLSGPDQILATQTVIDQLPADTLVRSRSLGAMDIRGRAEPCLVHRVEWQTEVLSDFFTVPAGLAAAPQAGSALHSGQIALTWLDQAATFTSTALPIHLGREAEAQFVVNDQRVSRLHARIAWRAGKFYLEDLSSYGTWVRFAGSDAVVALRRQECLLLRSGEIAMGSPFEDYSVPTVSFKLTGS